MILPLRGRARVVGKRSNTCAVPDATVAWVEEVELATLGWVHWHNTQRLHGYLGDLPPIEFEALHAAPEPSAQEVLSVTP